MSYDEPGEPAAVAAIVLDANAFGSGATPNVKLIETWATACQAHEAELWIPRLVALELAEHAIREAQEQQARMQSYSRQREKWGLDPLVLPAEVTLEAIVQAIEDAGAYIVETDPQSAVDGLHDQVLGTGPASTKGKVKTGGSDSAWIRSVVARCGGNGAGLVIVTADEGAGEFAREHTHRRFVGSPVRIVKNIGALSALFQEERPATDEERKEALEALRGLTTLDGTHPELEARSGLGPNLWWDRPERLRYPSYAMWGEPTFRPDPDTPELIGDLMMDPWSGTITGRVRFVGTIEERFGIGDDEHSYDSTRVGYVEGTATIAISHIGLGSWIAMDDVRLGLTR